MRGDQALLGMQVPSGESECVERARKRLMNQNVRPAAPGIRKERKGSKGKEKDDEEEQGEGRKRNEKTREENVNKRCS